jgi:hypothetical protein
MIESESPTLGNFIIEKIKVQDKERSIFDGSVESDIALISVLKYIKENRQIIYKAPLLSLNCIGNTCNFKVETNLKEGNYIEKTFKESMEKKYSNNPEILTLLQGL